MSGDQLFWVIVATAVTVILKWAAARWPGTPRHHDHDECDQEE